MSHVPNITVAMFDSYLIKAPHRVLSHCAGEKRSDSFFDEIHKRTVVAIRRGLASICKRRCQVPRRLIAYKYRKNLPLMRCLLTVSARSSLVMNSSLQG